MKITLIPSPHHDYATAGSASAAFLAGVSFIHIGTHSPIDKDDIPNEISVVIKYNRQQYEVIIPPRVRS